MENLQVVGRRRFFELQAGDMFKAVIQNIRPGEVTIKFSGGELYTARSMVLPEARIGEESLFSVRENDFEGKIVLEMVKYDADTKITNMLTSALKNAGITATDEMLKLARVLIDNELPVDAKTLNKAAFLALNEREKYGETNETEIFETVVRMLKLTMPNATVPTPERFTFDMRV